MLPPIREVFPDVNFPSQSGSVSCDRQMPSMPLIQKQPICTRQSNSSPHVIYPLYPIQNVEHEQHASTRSTSSSVASVTFSTIPSSSSSPPGPSRLPQQFRLIPCPMKEAEALIVRGSDLQASVSNLPPAPQSNAPCVRSKTNGPVLLLVGKGMHFAANVEKKYPYRFAPKSEQ